MKESTVRRLARKHLFTGISCAIEWRLVCVFFRGCLASERHLDTNLWICFVVNILPSFQASSSDLAVDLIFIVPLGDY